MGAALDDPAVIDHQQFIDLPNGAQAVGDDKGGAAGRQA
jgi:hypothetical protein